MESIKRNKNLHNLNTYIEYNHKYMCTFKWFKHKYKHKAENIWAKKSPHVDPISTLEGCKFVSHTFISQTECLSHTDCLTHTLSLTHICLTHRMSHIQIVSNTHLSHKQNVSHTFISHTHVTLNHPPPSQNPCFKQKESNKKV